MYVCVYVLYNCIHTGRYSICTYTLTHSHTHSLTHTPQQRNRNPNCIDAIQGCCVCIHVKEGDIDNNEYHPDNPQYTQVAET